MDVRKVRQLRKNPTDAERLLWRHICRRQLQGFKFRRQQPIGKYVVDFVCFEVRLIVEVDGGQHQEQLDYDRHRTAWLQSQGFRVIRYWNHEVLAQIESVLTDISSYLTPSP